MAQPVSLSRAIIPRLFGGGPDGLTEYAVSHKADGDRALLGFEASRGQPTVFTLDRKGNIRTVEITIRSDIFDGTLFDVEITPEAIHIFDAISVHGTPISNKHYVHRLELARACLQATDLRIVHSRKPSTVGFPSAFPDTEYQFGNRLISTKPTFPVCEFHRLPIPSFKTDGFIFTNLVSPVYTTQNKQTQHDVIKWKSIPTVDFYASAASKIVSQGSEWLLYQTTGGKVVLHADHKGKPLGFARVRQPSAVPLDCIWECSWENENWKFLRVRPDKTCANSVSTLLRTLADIAEHITLGELEAISAFGFYHQETGSGASR